MQVDPLRNVVAFTLKTEEKPRIGQGAAKDPACVRSAWESATKTKPA